MENIDCTLVAKNIADPERLAALRESELLDSPPEESFDRLTRLATEVLGAPVSVMTLVDAQRQFFKSQSGMGEPLASARQTPLSHSFCQYVVGTAAPVIVPDARLHPILRHNPAVKDYEVIAYVGVPLTGPNGRTLGSFCAVDGKPRVWSARDVMILQEIAVSVMTEIQLKAIARQLRANFVDLQTAESRRDELVHMLVHDLRNPLGALFLTLESFAGNPKLETDDRETLGLALEGAEGLLKMINEILDVSKAEAGRLTLELSDIRPGELIESARARIASMAAEARVRLAIEVPTGIPRARGDADKLRRVLVNLLSNAIQHTPPDGSVTARAYATEENLVFEVTDTGCGIPPEARGKIFEKFGQQAVRKVARVSTGLGLPFCKLAVEAHGGTISVESEVGRGTTFRFTVPRAGV